jgi:hypothetical protein
MFRVDFARERGSLPAIACGFRRWQAGSPVSRSNPFWFAVHSWRLTVALRAMEIADHCPRSCNSLLGETLRCVGARPPESEGTGDGKEGKFLALRM